MTASYLMPTALGIFALVYLGMIFGRFPRLAVDRTGIALLGAIALLASGTVSPQEAWLAIDAPTIALLFGLMVVSSQFQLGGFYARVTQRLASAPHTPPVLLAQLVTVTGLLSAILTNDVVCLAMAPVLAHVCRQRQLNPIPFLLALACAANVGSALTLIGNPQNMLIGQALDLSFAGYLLIAAVPTALGLLLVWAIIAVQFRRQWAFSELVGSDGSDGPDRSFQNMAPFNRWQTAKGIAVTLALMAAFLLAPWPREIAALAAAGLLLLSRRMATRQLLGLVDWHLLVLFAGLFVVNHALQSSGGLDLLLNALRSTGIALDHPDWLFAVTVILSNLVSNVPAVMLLLPTAEHPLAGPILALASTLAGNLFIVGSIANIIVVEQAALLGIRIDWRTHARTGVPITLGTLAVAGVWLWLL